MIRKISYILAALFLTGASALAATTADSLMVMLKDSVVLAQKPDGHRDTLARKVERKYTDIYLDTVTINVKNYINDYSMVGVQYGVSLNQMMFNPTKKQKMQFNPINVGIVYTKYGKMFGYMPYFGFQTGFFYGKEGYEFKKDKKTGEYTESVDGATSGTYEYIEVPLLAHMHMDVWHLKFIVNGGLFGGYRMSVERQGSLSDDKYLTASDETRSQLGLKRGVEIVSVGPGKVQDAGAEEGFVILYVNDEPVSKPEDVINIAKKAKRAVYVEGVTKYGKSAYFAFGKD